MTVTVLLLLIVENRIPYDLFPGLRGHDAAGTLPLEWHPVTEHGMPQPLSNIFVLDFSTLLPGPMATLMLAEAGAEVLKVEKPGGEDMQRFEPRIGETSAPYAVLNRGKSILSLDLKSADASRR